MSAFAAASAPSDEKGETGQADQGQALWDDGDEEAAALAAAAADDATLLAPQVRARHSDRPGTFVSVRPWACACAATSLCAVTPFR